MISEFNRCSQAFHPSWNCKVTLDLPWRPDEYDETDLNPPWAFPWSGDIPPDLPGKDHTAVFDTGATRTQIADEIGLIPETSREVHTSNGIRQAGVYYASLWLPNIAFPFIRIFDTNDDCLRIGMDIIGQSRFSIHYNPDRFQTTFSFSFRHLYPTSPPPISVSRGIPSP